MNYEPLQAESRTVNPNTCNPQTSLAGINLQIHFLLMLYMLYHRIVMENLGWHCVTRRSSGGELDIRFGGGLGCMRFGVLGRCFWLGHEGSTQTQENWRRYTSEMGYESTPHPLDMHIIHWHGRWGWRLMQNYHLIVRAMKMMKVVVVRILRRRRTGMILSIDSTLVDTKIRTMKLISLRHPCSLMRRKNAFIGRKRRELNQMIM
mmetsp:Transcript_21863/g.33101  ORF Transcript_21863/g.33101 Transcript_21863/m.33101 type:complete len:205 (+) Transcript_21863:606-1220(+)